MTAPPSVLVFDVNETLIDIDAMAPLFEQIFGDARAMREWFGQLVMYSMTTALSGCYVDFFTLGQGMLRMLGEIHGTRITDADLRPHQAGHVDDAGAPRCRRRAQPCCATTAFGSSTLTNSPPNPGGASPLESAGLGGYFERQFSVDACRTYKPARDVYDYVCRELQVSPADCMMVAAHVWDTIGAQSAGLQRGTDHPAGQRAAAARRPAATDARRRPICANSPSSSITGAAADPR